MGIYLGIANGRELWTDSLEEWLNEKNSSATESFGELIDNDNIKNNKIENMIFAEEL